MKRCPKCGEEATEEDVFCEADGTRLDADSRDAPPASVHAAAPQPTRCSACGLADADPGDGYCSACGHRLAGRASPPPAPAFRRVAAPVGHSPDLAELTDRGLRHPHNEDATAVAAGMLGGEAWAVLVVCDGVSSSMHADRASQIASTTTRDALAHFLRSGDAAFEGAPSAMATAIRAAHVAVCATPIDRSEAPEGEEKPPLPGTTLVAALVFRRRVVVGWIGDSRAYWIAGESGELLTRDHSWVNETVARGEMTESEAMAAPLAHALTRCLGPLEVGDATKIEEIVPEVRVRDLPGAGSLVLCTDGLWNYATETPAVAALVRAAGERATAGQIAAELVNHALRQGGADNVSVAVYRHR